MRILIADDDEVARMELEALLTRQGFEVTEAGDGAEALEVFRRPDPPDLAILDWMMETVDGPEVCESVRADPKLRTMYLILLTSRGDKAHILEGLQAGANDYVTKPFDRDELLARVRVGARMVQLQAELTQRILDLEAAKTRENQLRSLLPICCYCKSIRDGQNYWHQVEAYLSLLANTSLSHGVCPDCWEKVVLPQYQRDGIALPPRPKDG